MADAEQFYCCESGMSGEHDIVLVDQNGAGKAELLNTVGNLTDLLL